MFLLNINKKKHRFRKTNHFEISTLKKTKLVVYTELCNVIGDLLWLFFGGTFRFGFFVHCHHILSQVGHVFLHQ